LRLLRYTGRCLSVIGFAAVLAGCGRQSIVSARSPQTSEIRTLWWFMLGAATIVFAGAVVMLVVAWLRRSTPGLPLPARFNREPVSQGLVVVFGIGIPVVTLVALFVVSNVWLVNRTAPPDPRRTQMTIDVIGHQWWWEIRYPGSSAVTANEIHIPTATRVNVVATTADVIHSFWVPELARKIDEVPGRRNRVLLYASRSGVYRGQCAEFCGLQHANMALEVVAQPLPAFRAWLAHMSSPASLTPPTRAQSGARLFFSDQCASCHQIRGTSAQGTVGPDLTHVASRATLAALTIPNHPIDLERWITNPQSIKPGNRMPDLGLSRSEVAEIAGYLESLR
jgi:cytochrome c oxidase subunit II